MNRAEFKAAITQSLLKLFARHGAVDLDPQQLESVTASLRDDGTDNKEASNLQEEGHSSFWGGRVPRPQREEGPEDGPARAEHYDQNGARSHSQRLLLRKEAEAEPQSKEGNKREKNLQFYSPRHAASSNRNDSGSRLLGNFVATSTESREVVHVQFVIKPWIRSNSTRGIRAKSGFLNDIWSSRNESATLDSSKGMLLELVDHVEQEVASIPALAASLTVVNSASVLAASSAAGGQASGSTAVDHHASGGQEPQKPGSGSTASDEAAATKVTTANPPTDTVGGMVNEKQAKNLDSPAATTSTNTNAAATGDGHGHGLDAERVFYGLLAGFFAAAGIFLYVVQYGKPAYSVSERGREPSEEGQRTAAPAVGLGDEEVLALQKLHEDGGELDAVREPLLSGTRGKEEHDLGAPAPSAAHSREVDTVKVALVEGEQAPVVVAAQDDEEGEQRVVLLRSDDPVGSGAAASAAVEIPAPKVTDLAVEGAQQGELVSAPLPPKVQDEESGMTSASVTQTAEQEERASAVLAAVEKTRAKAERALKGQQAAAEAAAVDERALAKAERAAARKAAAEAGEAEENAEKETAPRMGDDGAPATSTPKAGASDGATSTGDAMAEKRSQIESEPTEEPATARTKLQIFTESGEPRSAYFV